MSMGHRRFGVAMGCAVSICLVIAACKTAFLNPPVPPEAKDRVEHSEGYVSERVITGLKENGAPVRLHFIIHKPPGAGPFPVLVFSHGSTGRGTAPSEFRKLNPSWPMAGHFVRRGWMVVAPHRRGRGWSDGRYDEGFNFNRSRGYTCDTSRSLEGFDRALTDLGAAVSVLRERPDVDGSRIVIGGQSRGGILSVAFAGENRDTVKGVLNFVGGWLSTDCPTAIDVNVAAASKGTKFGKETLWLYAAKDAFYPLAHARKVFDIYRNQGGKGEFVAFESASHELMWETDAWREVVNRYMASLGFAEFKE